MNEIRTLWLGGAREGIAITQTAIPWCTTHDRWTEGFGFCRANDMPTEICEVSLGGPDHKWWQDE